ncbi:MAG TPA: 23S rRNA (guanosine(2251)-2'-O)-methyltransferase RlmB [Actinobacteria bacterium]|nr:23S rRNA (guanosine(2251)-2'-O)-methyltransferase RlmB [Actinomycetota bacterium]
MDIIEGRNPILEALRGRRRIKRILLAKALRESDALKEIKRIAREREIPIKVVDRKELDSISHLKAHQGVVAYAEPLSPISFNDFLISLKGEKEPPVVLLLDEVTDPQNLGSLMRSADAVGASGIVITRRRSVGLTPAVVKASAGAVEHIPLVQVGNLVYAIERLKGEGFWIIGGSTNAKDAYFEADLKGRVAFVLGSEGKGLSRLVEQRCDFLVRIPMHGKISSLNVAVAGALLMYEARRQRMVANS